ncbi:alpha/beta hydrolase [Thiolapillus sp.]
MKKRTLLLVICSGLLSIGVVFAGQSGWTLPQRFLPPPEGASAPLQKAIASLPAPDVAMVHQLVPANEKEWRKLIDSTREQSIRKARELARNLSVKVEQRVLAGVPVFSVTPSRVMPQHKNHLFLHLHGGAYVFNGSEAATYEAALIADRIGIPVLSVDYRMPPDHPFPAALDDAVAVYRELLKQYPAGSLAIGGTSAGGGLALATLLRLKELDLPLPAALFGGTPWSDLTLTGDSYHLNEGADHVLVTGEGLLASAARLYAGDRDLAEPLLSPVHGDYSGFPPAILVSGTRDLFLSNTVRVYQKLRAAGVPARLEVFEGFSHGDYLSMYQTPESRQMFKALSEFLNSHLP